LGIHEDCTPTHGFEATCRAAPAAASIEIGHVAPFLPLLAVERIANRACLAKIKRQRIFNHHANSSRPTSFGASAEGRSKGPVMKWIAGPVALLQRLDHRVCRPQSEVQLQFCDDPPIAHALAVPECR